MKTKTRATNNNESKGGTTTTSAFNIADFAVTIDENVPNNAPPRGTIYARVGLPKRGKTYWGARWNPTHDPKRTLFLDCDKCVLRYPWDYPGMTTLPIISWAPPIDANGKTIPPEQRGYFVKGKQVKAWSFKEAIALIRAMSQNGLLQANYDVVCIDTVDILQDWSESYHLSIVNAKRKPEDRVDTIGELGTAHGSAWSDSRMVLTNALDSLGDICRSAEVDLVLDIHAKTTTQVGNVWQRDPALRGGVTAALFGMVDVIGYCNIEDTNKPDGSDFGTVYQGQRYTISYTVSSEVTTGGTRLGPIVNKTLPNCYQAIMAEYAKEVPCS